MTRLRRSDLTSTRFWLQFAGSAFAAVGFVAVLAGLYDVLFPDTVGQVGQPVAVAVLVLSVLYGIVRAWPRAVQETYDSPNTVIRIVPGDLLAQDAHLVIGMADTFDTDPRYIAATSLQMKFLQKMLGGDTGRFDFELDRSLHAEGVVPTGTVQKPGKTIRYELGTVATLDGGSRKYFCVAYTSMDESNVARASIDGVVTSLSSLWKAVCRYGNGAPVAMPVIGQGQARLSQSLSPADAIRLQIMSFWLASREERLCSELRIVVLPEMYDSLNRGDLQQFLTSLKPS